MPPTDEELAAAIRQRDASPACWRSAQDACTQLYQRHARHLLAFLASRVRRADLDDIHQAVWERVWRYLPEGFEGGNFRAWLYKIAHSRLIDETRKKRPDRLGDDYDPADPSTGMSCDPLLEQERLAALEHCLQQLTHDAACLVRARLAGTDYATICQDLGIQPAQAHKLFHTAKSQLQDCVNRTQP
jgi:RNA polymerase sigma factor (sigma-70 family)